MLKRTKNSSPYDEKTCLNFQAPIQRVLINLWQSGKSLTVAGPRARVEEKIYFARMQSVPGGGGVIYFPFILFSSIPSNIPA